MKQIYTSYNAANAHIIKHYLEQNGVTVFIHGEMLAGAIGGIATDDHIKILVADEDVEKARELIEQWEKSVPDNGIGESLTLIDKTPRKKGDIILLFLTGALAGWFAKDFIQLFIDTASEYAGKVYETGYDQNGDGKSDVIYTYKNEQSITPIKSRIDYNFDGVFDAFAAHDSAGIITFERADYDLDGKQETKNTYSKGQIAKSETDNNADGVADELGFYQYGFIVEYHFLDPLTQRTVKILYYKDNGLVSAKYDSDRDGKMDIRYLYDEYEEITGIEKLP